MEASGLETTYQLTRIIVLLADLVCETTCLDVVGGI